MASKVGKLIKEARLAADLTQEKLARKVGGGLTAADISKAERGETELPLATLRKIAKATGVTQSSLVDAAKGTEKPKKAAARKSAAKEAKKTAEKKPKTPSNAGISMRVTATEKKLIEAYRLADSDTKKSAMKLLKGESSDLMSTLLGGKDADDVADMIGDALGSFLSGK